MRSWFARIVLVLIVAVSSARFAHAAGVDFNRDIRPILAGKCFTCHGPDDKVRKANLRLDIKDGATAAMKSGNRAIVPGDPSKSELFARITSDEKTSVMPPPKSGPRLSAREVDVLKRWIAEGAPFAVHWSYAKPIRHPLPTVQNQQWPINGIDHFILARLEREGLKPTVAADRYALVRRLSIDLTGLPPTIEMAEQFAKDTAPDAYEKLVDRLLASPAYGERWAQVWLDLARYADSQGYANDPDRTIWRWRDWLIQALNDNMTYDRFTIEMLAGDLLPNVTPSQLIATGFHRNTLTNTEGGTSPEEFRSAAIVDRVNTTMQVWMATTMACAQCHNHKYDPLSQKEYFQIYAILNNTEDNNAGNDAPTLQVPAIGHDADVAELQVQLADAKRLFDAVTAEVDAALPEWEKTVDQTKLPKQFAPLLDMPADKREKGKQQALIVYHRSQSELWKTHDAAVKSLDARLKKVLTTVPILREIKPRQTHIQMRGNFLDKGEEVHAGLPAVFPQPSAGESINRLTFARWLVSTDNPLTARVAVNRLWEEIFGIGIVETSEDFGMQGELPSHPELLDWLATEYIRLGWDTKQMLKLLVTSAAYRQSSQVSDDLRKRDPFNRLLARGPRVRLSGEEVRDQALHVSGLLSPKMYGPPVQPPKPSFGLSAAFGGTTDWQADTGENRYRRGLYIRVRRNAPYPSLTTFDAPERTVCNVRRLRTNTPLQALVTMNDPVFVEAAQAMARRIAKDGGSTIEARVAYAFRLCLTRPPSERETQRLTEVFTKANELYSGDPARATAMATKPLGPAPKEMNVSELAAWTVVANVLLNLDEALAKR